MAAPVLTVANNAALTATGNSSGVVVQAPGNIGELVNCLVAVTAASGTTPSMTVSLQWSWDNSTWITASAAETFAAMTTTGVALLQVPSRAVYVRAAWTISGTTPSFTTAIAIWS